MYLYPARSPANLGSLPRRRRARPRRLSGLGLASSSIQNTIVNAANANGVPPALALAVAQQESSFNPGAVSPAGAQGLFQLMPATAASLGVTDPFDAAQSAQGGTAYLAQLYAQFGNWGTALAAYNWGPGNVSAYGAAAAPASTQAYVSSALSAAGLSPATPVPASTPLDVAASGVDASAGIPPSSYDYSTAAPADDSGDDSVVAATSSSFSMGSILLLTGIGLAVYMVTSDLF